MSLRNGLLAYYKCDEASGDLLDATGNANTLAVFRGAPGSGSGIISGSRTFTAGADGADCAGVTGLASGSAFTIDGWIFLSSKTDFITFWKLGSGDFSLIYDQANDRLSLQDGSSTELANSGSSPPASTWLYVAISSDGSTNVNLRVNSTDHAGSFSSVTFNNGDFSLPAGGSDDRAYDEIGVWNRVLTSTELDALYGSGSPPSGPGFGYALHFAMQPTNAGAAATITPSPAVEVLDETSTRDTNATDSITLAIGTNPGGGTLTTGTNPKAATSGLATFNGTSINNAGAGYTLTAAATNLTGATSSTFNITAAFAPTEESDLLYQVRSEW